MSSGRARFQLGKSPRFEGVSGCGRDVTPVTGCPKAEQICWPAERVYTQLQNNLVGAYALPAIKVVSNALKTRS